MDNLLTVLQVAAVLQVSRTTIWRWCSEGQLPAVKIGRGWRIRRKDLDRYIQSGSNLPHSRAAAERVDAIENDLGRKIQCEET